MPERTDVVVLVDLQNVMLPAQDAIRTRSRCFSEGTRTRIHFANLYLYAHAGRPVRRAVFAAALRPSVATIRPWLERLEPAAELMFSDPDPDTNREVTVDDDLIAVIDELIQEIPATLVLLTGDGAGHRRGAGFLIALQRLMARGWAVELVGWGRAMHTDMRRFVDAQSRGHVLPLEDVLNTVTFIEGGRAATRVDLGARPCAAAPGGASPSALGGDAAAEITELADAMAREGLVVDAAAAAAFIERWRRAA